MTDQWNHGSGVQDPTPDGNARTNSPGDRWLRRPRRSTGDRKIAGVAGGLGRAFGIDPVLIRVAFVVLTIFGGFGGLLYVLGWLLLPADGDEVSAAEALLGRGRSSVPPPLAVGLGIVAVVSAFSMFSWGLPFLPLAIGGVILLAIMRKRRRFDQRARWGNNDWARGPWGQSRAGLGGADGAVGERRPLRGQSRSVRTRSVGRLRFEAESVVGSWQQRSAPARARRTEDPRSRQPAFWEQPATGSRSQGPAPSASTTEPVNFTKSPGAPAVPSRPARKLRPCSTNRWLAPLRRPGTRWVWRRSPGICRSRHPFPSRRRRRAGIGGVITRVTMGATLLVGGLDRGRRVRRLVGADLGPGVRHRSRSARGRSADLRAARSRLFAHRSGCLPVPGDTGPGRHRYQRHHRLRRDRSAPLHMPSCRTPTRPTPASSGWISPGSPFPKGEVKSVDVGPQGWPCRGRGPGGHERECDVRRPGRPHRVPWQRVGRSAQAVDRARHRPGRFRHIESGRQGQCRFRGGGQRWMRQLFRCDAGRT